MQTQNLKMERTGSETVKITGSILAQHEANTAALQASRNAKMTGFAEQVQYMEESSNSINPQNQKELANALRTTTLKESRNKNRI